LDIIATDHAPHTLAEKDNLYNKAPSGLPLIQHSLNIMLEFYQQRRISLEKMVDKMCHKPAECFEIKDRGYLREGYFADLVLLNTSKQWTVNKDNILYKCGWSPLEDYEFTGKVLKTFVNGNLVFDEGNFNEEFMGKRLEFSR
jgi:dihydroorotase